VPGRGVVRLPRAVVGSAEHHRRAEALGNGFLDAGRSRRESIELDLAARRFHHGNPDIRGNLEVHAVVLLGAVVGVPVERFLQARALGALPLVDDDAVLFEFLRHVEYPAVVNPSFRIIERCGVHPVRGIHRYRRNVDNIAILVIVEGAEPDRLAISRRDILGERERTLRHVIPIRVSIAVNRLGGRSVRVVQRELDAVAGFGAGHNDVIDHVLVRQHEINVVGTDPLVDEDTEIVVTPRDIEPRAAVFDVRLLDRRGNEPAGSLDTAQGTILPPDALDHVRKIADHDRLAVALGDRFLNRELAQRDASPLHHAVAISRVLEHAMRCRQREFDAWVTLRAVGLVEVVVVDVGNASRTGECVNRE
jgi:hypothetical protein